MANTKVTGDLIASGTITAANLVSGTLDSILGTYLSTNSYATESYVTTAVSNLIDAAPASLDTLNELAAALNDDANFATTVTDSIATKLPLAGGNITGNLSVNTNALFVDAANNWVGIGTSSPSRPIHILAPTPGIKLEDTTGNDFGEIVSVDGDLYIRADEGATQADSSIRFQIDQSERARIDSSGNVGIGTSPDSDAQLHVYRNASSARVRVEREFNPKLDLESLSGYAQIGTLNNFPLAFQTNAAERMRITSSGNVGINTSSPADTLQVNGYIRVKDNSPRIRFEEADTTDENFEIRVNAGELIFDKIDDDFSSNRTERLRIDSSGNVGIGISSPATKVDIAKDDIVDGVTLRLTNTHNGSDWGLGSKLGVIDFYSSDTSSVGVKGSIELEQSSAGTTNPSETDFVFKNFSSGSLSEKMRITSSGRVGIGTASPASLLHIYDSSSAEIKLETTAGSALLRAISDTLVYRGDSHIFQSEGGTERLRIASSGNVGIGTVTPDNISSTGTILSISKSGALTTNDILGSLTFITADPSYTVTYADGVTAEISSITESATGAAYGLAFSTGTISGSDRAERMRINSSGRVGIGTSTPAQSLDVVGNIQFSGRIAPSASTATAATPSICAGFDYDTGIFNPASNTMAFSTAGTERMRINSSGNVGIGTASPVGKLSVEASGNHITMRAPTATAGKYWALDVTSANQFYLINNAGTQYLTMTDGGNVGIGTASPAYELDIQSTSPVLRIKNTTAPTAGGTSSLLFEGINNFSGVSQSFINSIQAGNSGVTSLAFGTSGSVDATATERMRITEAGNVGIGTSSPGGKLHVRGGNIVLDQDGTDFEHGFAGNGLVLSHYGVGPSNAIISGGGADPDTLLINNGGASTDWSNISIHANGSERMRIISGGSASTIINLNSESGGNTQLRFGDANSYDFTEFTEANTQTFNIVDADFSNGVRLTQNSNTWGGYSDRRLKQKITETSLGLNTVLNLRPVEYEWKKDAKKDIGFIAQELKHVSEYFAEGDDLTTEYGEYDQLLNPMISYETKIVPVLVKAIQELKDIIDQQQIEIDNLKAQLNG